MIYMIQSWSVPPGISTTTRQGQLRGINCGPWDNLDIGRQMLIADYRLGNANPCNGRSGEPTGSARAGLGMAIAGIRDYLMCG